MNSLFTLKNKIVIVTGACGLLGKQHVEAIAESGGTPILLDKSKKDVNQLSSLLNDKYDINSIGYNVDITNEKKIKSNCKEILSHFGRIDALVNNAANNPKVEDIGRKNFLGWNIID